MDTVCPRCRGLIDADEYFHLAKCPHCSFDLSRSRNRFTLAVTAVLIAAIWLTWLRFVWLGGPKDIGLPTALTVLLGIIAVWYRRKEVLVRKRDEAGASLYLVSPTAIAEFWRRQSRSRQPSSMQSTYADLGARAARTAQSLRRRWLARDAAEVADRLQWAQTNLPEAALFAMAESALLRMGKSSGDLYGRAFGGFGGIDDLAEAHASSLIELSDLHNLMIDRLRTEVSSKEIGEDLGQLSAQIEGVLRHANLMYS